MKEIPTTSLAFVGYKLASKCYTYPLPPLKRIIQILQRELHIPIMIVEAEDEDDDEDPTLFVCCYAERLGGMADIAGLAGAWIPEGFEKVGRMVKLDGGLGRMVCLSGRVYVVGVGEQEKAGWVLL